MDDELKTRILLMEQELDGLPGPRTTWFLEPERAGTPELAEQISHAAKSPVVDAILKTGAGAIAVLNEQRQVIALNSAYLELLGVTEPGDVLGLRHGEAAHCVLAQANAPGGCGTGQACRTCGAAISILAAMEKSGPAERDCALTVDRDGTLIDAEFRVRAQSLDLPPEKFILLSLTDVSAERRRAALERAFFHDLAELLSGVVAACDAMDGASHEELTLQAADAREVAAYVAHELKLQRALTAALPTGYAIEIASVPLGGILDALGTRFRHHPIAAGKRLRISGGVYDTLVETDPFLLQRLLTYLLLNAFEASPERAEVTLRVDAVAREVVFRVWNPGAISSSVAPRIFQRYFTTRSGAGRGHGTFAVKYFGEKLLRGRVGFTSTKEAGTTFELRIPRSIRG